MITLLTGDFGSGKTGAMCEAIAADVHAGIPSFLLVPEQQTVTTEGQMADRLPPSAPLLFEVTNFTRLANTVFRRVGGLSYRYAGAGTRTLFMWRAMGELLPLLHEKEGKGDLGRVRKMTSAMGELSAHALSPGDLEKAARALPEGDRLREKLEDLSLLYTLWRALLREQYDDVAEDLDRLAKLLSAENLLAGTHIYVDGFTSFTEQEWRILRALAAGCEMTVTLTLPEGRAGDLTFEETRHTYARLQKMAAEAGTPFVRRDMGEGKRSASPCLGGVLPHLFSTTPVDTLAGAFPPEGELRIVSSQDAFYAAAYIAADIARRVQEEGALYRDFAVIARSADRYAGILDIALSDADIPCFMAKKTDISAYAAVKLIYTAYAVCTSGWRQGDVISYLKCGMSGVSVDDVDIFELYVTRWKLNGRRFTGDTAWNMNPDGYTDRLSDRGKEIIRRVEAVRCRLVEQLTPLSESCGMGPVSGHCRALFRFLSSLSVEEQLKERAAAARLAGDGEEADMLDRLYPTLCDALDRLADTLPDVEVNAEQFTDLLRLLLSEVELARIPASRDAVTVGSADLLRIEAPRHVYLIGVNDGEFPATVDTASLFSEGECRILSELGLSLEPDLLIRAAKELFYFARAFSLGRESVTLLYTETTLSGGAEQPAAVLSRIRGLCGIKDIHTADLPPIDLLWRPTGASDYLGLLHGTPTGDALEHTLGKESRYAARVEALSHPVVEPECRLSPETANGLYGQGVYLTQSRMDRYVGCPFSYFCQYVLKLDAAPVIEFDAGNAGSLLHAVLERFFAVVYADGGRIENLGQETVERILDDILDGYLVAVCPPGIERTPRFAHLVATLRRSALLVVQELIEEFSQSDFRPMFFEMNLTEDTEDAPGAMPFTLENGTRVSLAGRVDRVDTYEKDGTTYLRVIDYKSGSKSFSLEDVERGLNTQLLVYMISLWKSQNPAFRRKLAGDGEILPAGVLYTGARAGDVRYNTPGQAVNATEDARRKIPRSGLLLDNVDVLRAMDKDLGGRYIPIKLKKDGSYYAASEKSLASLSRMGELVGEIDRVICRIAGDMQSGEASARPLNADKKHPAACRWCDMKPVCRSAET